MMIKYYFSFRLMIKMHVIFFVLDTVGAAPDNRGTEFVIGYMENDINVNTQYGNELFVTTMRTTTVNVQVQAPRFTSINLTESFTVSAGVVKQLFISSDIRMVGTSFDSKGILVSSDDEVVIYGVNKEKYTNDAFVGLPTDVLGTEYYTVCWSPATMFCELLIVGVYDGTTVNITLGPGSYTSVPITWQGTDYNSGDTINLSMDRFDTFQLQDSSGDITGSKITSTKVVSVFSGNKRTSISDGNSRDHVVEQLTPVTTWGKNFATVPVPGRTIGDMWKFVASEDNTQIIINGNGFSDTFNIGNSGSYAEKDIPSTSHCSIIADKPIMVVQFCKSQTSSSETADPMMMLIPPIELYAADYYFTTPKYSLGSYENFFMFVIKSSEKDGLLLDGSPFPDSTIYNSIPNTDLVAGYIEVSESTHSVRHTSTIVVFGGYLYGKANYETYGFPTGSRMASINGPCVSSTTEVGDGLDNDCDGLIDEELCTDDPAIDDDSDGSVDEDCATPFPVDGNWTEWNAWSSCSVNCTVTRTRTCTNPEPAYDGNQCSGNATEEDQIECTSCIGSVKQENETLSGSMTIKKTEYSKYSLINVLLMVLIALSVIVPCCCLLCLLLALRRKRRKKSKKKDKKPVKTVKQAWDDF